MKIKNIGNSNFILKDKRGNTVIVEPSFTIDVDDAKGRKLVRIYSNLEEVKEQPKVEPKVVEKAEIKEEVKEVVKEPKKKKGKK